MNESAVDSVFIVERELINIVGNGEIISAETTQEWDPGSIRLPMTDEERIKAIKAAEDAGLIDKVEAFRDFHNLSSRRKAKQLMENWGINPEPAVQAPDPLLQDGESDPTPTPGEDGKSPDSKEEAQTKAAQK
jgi:hypothetical protein